MMEGTPEQNILIAKKKFVRVVEDVKKIDELGKTLSQDPSGLPSFLVRESTVDKLYDAAVAHWERLLELSVLANDKEVPSETDKNNYAALQRWYYRIKEVAAKYNSPPGRLSLPMSSTMNTTNASLRVRLPKITLPEFSGRFSAWPIFRDTYLSLIHQEATLSGIEKFHYLVSRLKGPALDTIKSIPITEENYDQAWKALTRMFDSKRRLASSYLQQLLSFTPIKGRPTLESLSSFLTHVAESVSAFNTLKVPDPSEFILFELAIRGLDPTTREAFELAHTSQDFPKFSELVTFVEQRCLALSMLVDYAEASTTPQSTPVAKGKAHKPVSLFTNQPDETETKAEAPPQPSLSCKICSKSHRIKDCESFNKLTPDERYAALKSWKGCYNCLAPGHQSRQCRSPFCCQVCRRRHHTLLHLDEAKPSSEDSLKQKSSQTPPPAAKTTPPSGSALTGLASQAPQVLLGTARALIQNSSGQPVLIRLVLDSGSQFSFITEACVKRLGLVPRPFKQTIVGIGQSTLKGAIGRATCHLQSPKVAQSRVSTNAIVVSTIAPLLPQIEVPADIRNSFVTPELELADPEFWCPNDVDFLLGADLFGSILCCVQTYTPKAHQPYALSTIFGSVIMGPLPTASDDQQRTQPAMTFFTHLDLTLKRFWELEEPLGQPVSNSVDDEICEQHFLKTHSRTSSGRYVVSLPFKSKPRLGPSRGQALNRLVNLERKLLRSPSLKDQYSNFMQEYLTLKHMSPTSNVGEFIIPHHAVVKDSRKLRVVFDGSATTSNGSLNDHLLIGPKLQKDIGTLMLKFRLHSIVFTADIVKMYRQILVDPADRVYQHILWRENFEDEIQEYELNTVTYGLTSSPFLALRVIKQLVQDEGMNFPKASKVLLSDIYVDDIVTGASSEQEAMELQQEVIQLLEKGELHLSKWSTNYPPLLHAIDGGTNHMVTFDADQDAQIKVLGIQWDPINDVFRYKTTPPVSNEALTKRIILSMIARLYDPLGYLAPLIFYAKRILQATWMSGVGWDDGVPENVSEAWERFISDLHHIHTVTIPRHLNTNTKNGITIVGFCDASEKGYCAVIYFRRQLDTGRYKCDVLKAKTKLAPLKTICVPRLELCAALMLTQLYLSVAEFRQELPVYDTVLFSDSTVVLHWLRTSPHSLKTFVANRVTEILTTTQPEWWNHVRSPDNPADCGSRGLLPKDLVESRLWWHGPDWLSLPKSDWPRFPVPDIPAKLPESKDVASLALVASAPPDHDLLRLTDRISTYERLIRVTAYVLRFIHNAQRRISRRKQGPVTSSEFREANLAYVLALQRVHYAKPSEHVSLFRSLNVFTHTDGLLRVGGRLTNSDLTFSQKHPMLLPKRCPFNNLLIDYYHRIHMHVGPGTVQSILVQQYWIPSARNLVRERKFKCARCYKLSKQPQPPYMGNLPEARVIGGRAFLHTGVDFAGPFSCRVSSRRNAATTKAYLCVYVCMSTKAIHLEVVSDLSTPAFLASFDRFVSRRGLPSNVYSDCGKNFVGAARKLKEVADWHSGRDTQTSIINHVTPRNIEWSFNPPHSPHFGGLWEASVKMTKSLLYRTMGTASFTIEELSTIFIKIEAVINSRPISPMSSDPTDLQPLTPGHFLVGGPLTALPEPNLLDIHQYRLSKWQRLNHMTQHFWQRWSTEYLHTLQTRKKWTSTSVNLEVGDLVLIKEKNMAPLQWPTGRIISVHPGKDGVVRVANVRTVDGEYLRPVTNLVSLRPLTHPQDVPPIPPTPVQ